MSNNKIFLEMYTSTNDDISKISKINIENIECLSIPTFIFSFPLSFIIELCNFIPLTASASMAGINIIFCNNIEENKNNIPFPNSKT